MVDDFATRKRGLINRVRAKCAAGAMAAEMDEVVDEWELSLAYEKARRHMQFRHADKAFGDLLNAAIDDFDMPVIMSVCRAGMVLFGADKKIDPKGRTFAQVNRVEGLLLYLKGELHKAKIRDALDRAHEALWKSCGFSPLRIRKQKLASPPPGRSAVYAEPAAPAGAQEAFIEELEDESTTTKIADEVASDSTEDIVNKFHSMMAQGSCTPETVKASTPAAEPNSDAEQDDPYFAKEQRRRAAVMRDHRAAVGAQIRRMTRRSGVGSVGDAAQTIPVQASMLAHG